MCASRCVRVVIDTTRTYALLYRGAPPSEFLLALHFSLRHETLPVLAFALLRLCTSAPLRFCFVLVSDVHLLCLIFVSALRFCPPLLSSSVLLTSRRRLRLSLVALDFYITFAYCAPPPDVNAYSRLLVNMRFLCKKSFGQTHRQNRARACVH